jgi:hypothetical protein
MKAYRGSRYIALLVLNFGTRLRWVGRLGGPHTRSGPFWEYKIIFPQLGIQPRIVRPVAYSLFWPSLQLKAQRILHKSRKTDTLTRTRATLRLWYVMWYTVKYATVGLVCHRIEGFEKRCSGAQIFPSLTKVLYTVDLCASVTCPLLFLHGQYVVRETFVVMSGTVFDFASCMRIYDRRTHQVWFKTFVGPVQK